MPGFKTKVSVLHQCSEGIYYDGYTHDSRIVLQCKLGDYGILAKILCKNIAFIYKLSINPLIKEELLKDARTIRTILEKSEREVIK